MDRTVAERYQSLGLESAVPTDDRQRNELGMVLGQLAFVDGSPEPKGDALSASGVLVRQGLLVTMPFLRFQSSFAGPPAMARWLRSKGCADFRYAFRLGSEVASGDEDEGPSS